MGAASGRSGGTVTSLGKGLGAAGTTVPLGNQKWGLCGSADPNELSTARQQGRPRALSWAAGAAPL